MLCGDLARGNNVRMGVICGVAQIVMFGEWGSVAEVTSDVILLPLNSIHNCKYPRQWFICFKVHCFKSILIFVNRSIKSLLGA